MSINFEQGESDLVPVEWDPTILNKITIHVSGLRADQCTYKAMGWTTMLTTDQLKTIEQRHRNAPNGMPIDLARCAASVPPDLEFFANAKADMGLLLEEYKRVERLCNEQTIVVTRLKNEASLAATEIGRLKAELEVAKQQPKKRGPGRPRKTEPGTIVGS